MNRLRLLRLSIAMVAIALLAVRVAGARAEAVSHYAFEETSGDVAADSSPSGIDATRASDPGTVDLNVSGVFGSAVQMTNGWMKLAAKPAFHNSSFTFASWVKLPDDSPRTPIFANWSAGTPGGRGFLWEIEGTGAAMSFRNADGVQIPWGNDSPPDGGGNDGSFAFKSAAGLFADADWHHVAFSFDRSTKTGRLYVDGSLTDPLSEITTSRTNLDVFQNDILPSIGLKEDSTTSLVGSLDELWVFDQALTGMEIQSLIDTNVIPEPSTSILFGLGLAGLIRLVRRWR